MKIDVLFFCRVSYWTLSRHHKHTVYIANLLRSGRVPGGLPGVLRTRADGAGRPCPRSCRLQVNSPVFSDLIVPQVFVDKRKHLRLFLSTSHIRRMLIYMPDA